jgi:hypothetical protein
VEGCFVRVLHHSIYFEDLRMYDILYFFLYINNFPCYPNVFSSNFCRTRRYNKLSVRSFIERVKVPDVIERLSKYVIDVDLDMSVIEIVKRVLNHDEDLNIPLLLFIFASFYTDRVVFIDATVDYILNSVMKNRERYFVKYYSIEKDGLVIGNRSYRSNCFYLDVDRIINTFLPYDYRQQVINEIKPVSIFEE